MGLLGARCGDTRGGGRLRRRTRGSGSTQIVGIPTPVYRQGAIRAPRVMPPAYRALAIDWGRDSHNLSADVNAHHLWCLRIERQANPLLVTSVVYKGPQLITLHC